MLGGFRSWIRRRLQRDADDAEDDLDDEDDEDETTARWCVRVSWSLYASMFLTTGRRSSVGTPTRRSPIAPPRPGTLDGLAIPRLFRLLHPAILGPWHLLLPFMPGKASACWAPPQLPDCSRTGDTTSALFRIVIGEKDARGHGYGTEATRLVMDEAFDTLGLDEVRLEVFSHNVRAAAAYQRVGFEITGEHVEWVSRRQTELRVIEMR